MDVIQLLPDSVANQIAAGEVIQRPASVIKELVENAIDAGAKNIQVLVCDAGKASIQVIDDGCGMSDTDARLSFERHATSKIRKADDLFSLHTMGFRGEALASIAAVARVTLQTRRADDELGTRLVIAGSKVEEQDAAACPVGSNFLIENLFFNIPARRKFLKSNATEMNHITQSFERIVLVYPEISFSLYSNGVPLLQLRACNAHQRIIDIFGKRLNQQLLPVETQTTICNISGFVGKPESAKKKGCQQYFFVNGRYMKHPYFHKAVMSAYDRLVGDGEQVSYFVYFTVDPKDIDVNIHPVKTEIKFSNETMIWQILMATVRDAVGKFTDVTALDFDTEGKPDIPVFNPTGEASIEAPRIDFNPEYNPFNSPSKTSPSVLSGDSDDVWGHSSGASTAKGKDVSHVSSRGSQGSAGGYNSSLGMGGKTVSAKGWEELFEGLDNDSKATASPSQSQQTFFPSALNSLDGDNTSAAGYEGAATLPEEGFQTISLADLSQEHYQLAGQYIVTQVRSDLMLVDQNRASQRVLYERYMKAMETRNAHTQKVLFPEIVQFPPSYLASLPTLLDELSALGFEITDLGGGSYSVQGIPAGLGGLDAVSLVNDLVSEAVELGSVATERVHTILAQTLARKAATPYGELLSNEDMNTLLRQLFDCSAQRYTPDGKAIISLLTLEEIAKRLG